MIHPFDHNEVAVLNMVEVSSAVAYFDIGQTRRLGQSSQVLKLDHIALIQARYCCALHHLVALLDLLNEHEQGVRLFRCFPWPGSRFLTSPH